MKTDGISAQATWRQAPPSRPRVAPPLAAVRGRLRAAARPGVWAWALGGLVLAVGFEAAPARAAGPGLDGDGVARPSATAERALEAWWRAVPPPRRGGTFGQLVAQAALVNLGRPYGDGIWGEPAEAVALPHGPDSPPSPPAPHPQETPDALAPAVHDPGRDAFNCVTFIEASLAVARCRWQGSPDAACFARTQESLRFRDGRRAGWASQLHYFEDWLADNQARGQLAPMTAALGGQPLQAAFFFISAHPALYPPMATASARGSIAAQEAALSAAPHLMISRGRLAAAVPELQAGDIVSIVGSKPGLMITHTGFVHRGDDGHARLLHASSAHGRVVLIPDRLEDYVLRRPERRGVVVERPLPPL